MAERYRPFRDLRTPEDLLLVRREIKRAPVNVRMPEAYYPEICAWVTVRCDEGELFSDEGQTLMEGTIEGASRAPARTPSSAIQGCLFTPPWMRRSRSDWAWR